MPTRSHPESARIIREARQAAGLTQLELAEKLGVTIGTIGYYERGAGMPKTDNLFALCDILHTHFTRKRQSKGQTADGKLACCRSRYFSCA